MTTILSSDLPLNQEECLSLLDALPHGILIISPDLKVLAYNSTAEMLLEIGGQSTHEPLLVTTLLPDSTLFSAGSIDSLEESYGEESLILRTSKKAYPLSIQLRRWQSTPQTSPRLVLTLIDQEAQKSFERELVQAQRLESIGQLAAGVAHEINTPIQYVCDNTLFFSEEFSNIINLLSLYHELALLALEDEGLRAQKVVEIETFTKKIDLPYLISEIPLALEQTLEGAESVARIVKSIKSFSHPGIEEASLFKINSVVKSTVAITRNEWKYVSDIETKLDDSNPEVWGWPAEINQALVNLIVNAAHAIEDRGEDDKGTILISTAAKDNGTVTLSVSDTGVGIRDELLPKIFEPFFTTKEAGRGTGQGLSLVRKTIVEKHRGELDVHSEPGIGTTFLLRLCAEPPRN